MRRRLPNHERLTKIDKARVNTFAVEGPRGDRRSKPPCFNGSVHRKGSKPRPITLASHA